MTSLSTWNKALTLATETNNIVFMEWIFTRGAPDNLCECLLLATEKGHKASIDFLTTKMPPPPPAVKKFREFNPDGMKQSRLMNDFNWNRSKFMKDLEEGVVSQEEINHKALYGNTLLHTLCKEAIVIADAEIALQKLIEAGADVNVLNNNMKTPLMFLAKNVSSPMIIKMAKILLNAPNIKINETDDVNMTAIDYATKSYGDGQMFQLLLKAPTFNINHQDTTGMTILMYLCQQSLMEHLIEMMDILLKEDKIDVNMVDKNGYSAMMHVLINMNIYPQNARNKMESLWKHPNIDPNLVNSVNGNTPLMYLAENYHMIGASKLAEILMMHPKINKELKNKDGLTAAMIFHEKCYMAKLFKI